MPVKILMVCLGNICRSPLAEGILAAKLPIDKFKVESAGTGDWHIGNAPDSRSIAVAKKNKLDIAQQKGRQITKNDFEVYDYIYVMDNANFKNVINLTEREEHRQKVQIILNELYPNKNMDVPDPYFGLTNGFDIVYTMLDEVCNVIANKLIEKHG